VSKQHHRGHNEGSISLRRDGRWSAIITTGDSNGKRQRRTIYGRTRAEVAQALTAALRARDQGLPLPTGGLTLAAYLKRWLEHVQASVRPRTFEKFESVCRLHIIPDLGHIQITKLTPDAVQMLLNRKLAAGLAPQSVRHIRTVLGVALKRALKWNLVARNVSALTTGPRVERAPVETLSEEQANRLLDSIASHRLAALYTMALTVAMRRGEVLGTRWDDIDLDNRQLHVNQSLQRAGGKLQLLPLKTKSSTRPITIPDRLLVALKRHRIRQKEEQLAAGPEWRGNAHNLVFISTIGTSIEPRNMVRQFKVLLAKAGLGDAKFHSLRHTCATLLFEHGAHPKQVQALLGHSRISTTLDAYTHVVQSTRDDTASRIDDIFNAVPAVTVV
jgi:integrase